MDNETQQKADYEKIRQQGIPQKVWISGRNQAKVAGEVILKDWNHHERLKRALKFLGIAWGLALFSIFIPLAHFVLVPGFFLGGIVGCAFFYQQQSQNLGGMGTCPQCNQFFKIEKSSLVWPLEDVCAHCHEQVKIEKA